jgi:predicted TIM-barrel fold metal-dependent hydrolase
MAKLIDGDRHVTPDTEGVWRRLPEPLQRLHPGRTLFPALDHLHIAQGYLPHRPPNGPTGPEQWERFLDEAGIELAVLYTGYGLAYGRVTNLDWAVAVARAYNDWLHEAYLQRSHRLKGIGLVPLQEPEAAVAELRHLVLDLGMCGAMLPSRGLKAHLGSKEYWPVYAEAERLGCALGIHGGNHSGLGMDDLNVYAPAHALGHPFGTMIALAALLFNGVFDRCPGLRVGVMESGVAWLPFALERFDLGYEAFIPSDLGGNLLRLGPAEPVSDAVRRVVARGSLFVSCTGQEPGLGSTVRLLGHNPFFFGDYYHSYNPESPRRQASALAEREDVDATTRQGIQWGNARRLYGLAA